METLRLDKWLWFARFVKSRSLAQALIDEGTVTLNGHTVSKSSTPVKPGDRLTFNLRDRERTILVLALTDRRGPASEAALLYDTGSVLSGNGFGPEKVISLNTDDTDNHG